jgi:iron(III) transport system substrate-binding protein
MTFERHTSNPRGWRNTRGHFLPWYDGRSGLSKSSSVRMGLLLMACLVFGSACGRHSGEQVVVYVAVDRKDAEPILRSFEAETGIRVLAVYDAEAAKTTGLVARLIAESGRPRCDVFWNNEIVQTLLLAQRGMLDAYRSPAAETLPDQWKDPDGRWTGVATRARVIVYNTQYVAAEEIPRRLTDLTSPQWRGQVAVANPQFGTTRTHVAALFAAWGPDAAQAYLRALLENQVRIVDGNAMVTNLVAAAQPGASPIFVGLTDTDDVLSGQAEGQPIALIYPDQDADGTLVIPSTVCLVRDAPNPEAARRLMDYLLSPDTERRFTHAESGYRPVRVTGGSTERSDVQIRAMEVSYPEMLDQLESSSTWTAEHFRP